jgi:pimeloyl-ACP methyl ester carboxylesterase
MRAEVRVALPDLRDRRAFRRAQYAAMVRYPMSPSLMARRLGVAMREDFTDRARAITAPTLVVTGEPGLDRIVPVKSTSEYVSLVAGAREAVLAETGHIGCVTRPREFADIVWAFAREVLASPDARERTA